MDPVPKKIEFGLPIVEITQHPPRREEVIHSRSLGEELLRVHKIAARFGGQSPLNPGPRVIGIEIYRFLQVPTRLGCIFQQGALSNIGGVPR